MQLTKEQNALINSAPEGKTFLCGPSGTGKTTIGVQRMLALLNMGIPASSILVLTPQRTLAGPYQHALETKPAYSGSSVTLLTLGGLARRMVGLYWPIINDLAGFKHPNTSPSFLTLESSQYFMAHLITPLFEKGYFNSIVLERNRLYSQIIDNINKAAIVGFPHTEIGERLKSAWVGDLSQLNIYDNVQDCVNLFRNFCLENNLLDYSLQIELFRNLIWPSEIFQYKLFNTYKHVIYDNLEEDPPFAHDILQEWLPNLDSALLIFDKGGGFRRFLGAAPNIASDLREHCDKIHTFSESFTSSKNLQTLNSTIKHLQNKDFDRARQNCLSLETLQETLVVPDDELRFYPQMLDWVVSEVKSLIDSGTSPGEIVILAPFMSDMLRFSLNNRLEKISIPTRSHRPSRALRDEPAAQCLLTLTALAYPQWQILPSKFTLAYAVMQAIDDLDLVRAQLLVNQAYQKDNTGNLLKAFDDFPSLLRERITYRLGAKYEQLRLWLNQTNKEEALDIFLSRLFGEVLSQPGFRFHRDLDSGRVTANLIESVRKFRWAMAETKQGSNFTLGKEYLQMLADGVIAAQYLQSWKQGDQEAVFIAPAYTFLMNNQAVDYQFWLDISSSGWYARLEQPLTHPYVLSREWTQGQKWTAEHEFAVSQEGLKRLITGLLARCRKRVYLGISSLNENGSDERGLMIRLIQNIFQQSLRVADGG